MNWEQNWETIREYDEIKFDFFEGIAKISINMGIPLYFEG